MDLNLILDSTRRMPLYRQIYEQVREGILAGEYPAGERLPSSRLAAQKNGLARVTITRAYKQLEAEGYLISRTGSGTFVTDEITESTTSIRYKEDQYKPTFSRWGQRVLTGEYEFTRPGAKDRQVIDFGFGRSFPHIFPYDTWRRLLVRYLSTDDTILSRYGSVAGFFPLREAVAEHVRRLRGVDCSADQVVIVNGMQQALDILARLLLSSGDEVLVETPGYVDAFELFRASGAILTALAVDDNGFPVESIPDNCQARFAFVTPSNQFPRGGTMPLSRRVALLDWARKANALILEDDYDGELRYSDQPLAALQGLDKDGRVVYLGTFSKVLFPALRLGYVVLPDLLLKPFVKAMQLVDRGAPTLTQAAVTDFINEGHFERHLRRLRIEYGERRRILVKALENELSGLVQYSRVEAGLHVMLLLDSDMDEKTVVREAASAGVGVYPGNTYHVGRPERPSILLGYSGLRRNEIEQGVARLADVLAAMSGKI